MSTTSLPPPTAIRPHIRKVTIILLAVGWGIGALVTLLSAFDIRHFAGTTSAFALGYPVVLLVHFLVGSFVVGGILDLPNPSGLFGAVGRVVMSVVTLALVVGVVVADGTSSTSSMSTVRAGSTSRSRCSEL